MFFPPSLYTLANIVGSLSDAVDWLWRQRGWIATILVTFLLVWFIHYWANHILSQPVSP